MRQYEYKLNKHICNGCNDAEHCAGLTCLCSKHMFEVIVAKEVELVNCLTCLFFCMFIGWVNKAETKY